MAHTFLAKITTFDTAPPKPRPEPIPPGTKPPTSADDPWYGIDLGLGYLRPSHPIAPGGLPGSGFVPGTPPPRPRPEPGQPADPAYGIDENLGVLHPEHPIVLPPEPIPTPPPVDPAYGIDKILGWLRPTYPIILPPDPVPPETPKWKVTAAWTPMTGWIVVAIPTGLTPTPSKK